MKPTTLHKLLRQFSGPCHARLRLEIPQRSEPILDLGYDFKVAAADELLAKLESKGATTASFERLSWPMHSPWQSTETAVLSSRDETFGLTSQVRRAAVPTASNIVGGRAEPPAKKNAETTSPGWCQTLVEARPQLFRFVAENQACLEHSALFPRVLSSKSPPAPCKAGCYSDRHLTRKRPFTLPSFARRGEWPRLGSLILRNLPSALGCSHRASRRPLSSSLCLENPCNNVWMRCPPKDELLGIALFVLLSACAHTGGRGVCGANTYAGIGSATVLEAVLPSPRHEPSVFSDGKSVFVVGGLDGQGVFLSQIVRFDPDSNIVLILPEKLPAPTQAAAVVWTGNAAYFFGGRNIKSLLRQIVRYEPGTRTVTTRASQLPVASYSMGAVWTGSMIYLFGGFNGTDSNQILSYDPATDILSTLNATLPVGAEASSTFWDGSKAWILGGANSSGPTDAIQVFDPSTGQATLVGHLPYAEWSSPAFYDGHQFYLPGGASARSGYSSILRFDPSSGVATTLPLTLPVPVTGRVGVWVPAFSAAYLCGGADFGLAKHIDKIVRLAP